MSARYDLKNVNYQGCRDGVMGDRDKKQVIMWTGRQAVLHYREERDPECCWYAVRVRRSTDDNIFIPDASPKAETNLWYRADSRSNSNTRTRWDPNNDTGRN